MPPSRPDTFNILLYAGCIQSWKTWKSHGIPLFFPGLEKSWKFTPGLGNFIKSHEN